MPRGRVVWVRANRAHPCPVCGRTHYCSVSADGGLVFCTTIESDRPSRNDDVPGWLHRPAGAVNGHAKRNGHSTVVARSTYPIRDGAGALVANHQRLDLSDGDKRVWWELPDGTKGLGGRELETLPLYGAELLAAAGRGVTVFVCEGEKATDALRGLGLLVVGTATGADTIPSDDVLADLLPFDVVLWPDNDAKGARHMQRIAERLLLLGATVRVLGWPEAPDKGDAADFTAAGETLDRLRVLYREAVEVDADWTTAHAEPEPTPEPEPEPADEHNLTDLGNSRRLAGRHGPEIRFCKEWNRWTAWVQRSWETDATTATQERAKETAMSIYDESVAATSTERAEALRKWAKASESARAIAAMVQLARSDPRLQIRAEQLDADPMLFNCANGTVELGTGALREHRREDYITKISPVAHDAAATCPGWLAYLDRVFAGDAELIGFVQRAAGYSLTGKTGERVMFILHGVGHNGKTTFIEVMAHILGSYAMSTPVETLIAKKDRGIPNDVARLKSARFVSATETEQGDKLAEAFVKAVTGGDRVTARFLHAEFFEFVPQLKLWLATNHRPQISGTDPAIWDRIRLIPFEVEIPEPERDRGLKQRLIDDESAGVLNWAIEGCRRWQAEGLAEPERIRRATAAYRSDEDVLGAFLEDSCVVQPLLWCRHDEIYGAFKEWSKRHGEEEMGSKTFSQRLCERTGIRRARTADARGYSGVRLLASSTTRGRQEDGLP